MRRSRRPLVVAALALASSVVVTAPGPAGAAVVVSSTGSTVTATITGSSHGLITLQCVSGQVRVVNTPASPSISCSALTAISFNGDSAAQTFGPPSPLASFPNLVTVTMNGAGGADTFTGSAKRDIISAGTGNDTVTLPAGGTDDAVGMASDGNDVLSVVGTTSSDTIIVDTGSPTTQTVVTRGAWDVVATSTDVLRVNGAEQGDTLDATTVTAASTLERIELRGDGGNDLLACGAVPCSLVGADGSNGLIGGAAADAIFSTSPGDTIRGNGGVDGISDSGSGRVGRTIDDTGTGASRDNWQVGARGDVVVRTRPAGTGDVAVTVALARTGRQLLTEGVGHLIYDVDGTPLDRAVFDLAAVNKGQRVDGDDLTYVDIVVPSGSWSTAAGVVSFTGPYEDIDVNGTTNILVRVPYTDADLRFAHRVIRDIDLRFPTAMERDTLHAALDAGTTTRAQAVLALTDTDLVRGIDVDRAFVGILRRTTDLAGRTYWIQRLEDGLVLRRLRANLYGSPEYVTNSGGTDQSYVLAAYRDILGRSAPQGDIDYWVSQITDVGLTRGTVADRFLNTPEARGVVIRDLFVRWADREPTDAEVTTWQSQLGSSSTDGELALIRFLAASGAYYSRPDV